MKQRISGILLLIASLVMLFAIQRMIAHGLGGDVHSVKLYAALMLAALFVSIVSGLVYYYARSTEVSEDEELERMRAEVNTLGHIGQNQPKQPAEQSQRHNDKIR